MRSRISSRITRSCAVSANTRANRATTISAKATSNATTLSMPKRVTTRYRLQRKLSARIGSATMWNRGTIRAWFSKVCGRSDI